MYIKSAIVIVHWPGNNFIAIPHHSMPTDEMLIDLLFKRLFVSLTDIFFATHDKKGKKMSRHEATLLFIAHVVRKKSNPFWSITTSEDIFSMGELERFLENTPDVLSSIESTRLELGWKKESDA